MIPRAVLWDLDGTLVDSAELHYRSWHETMAAHGIEITRDRFRRTFGQRNDAILGGWLGPDAAPDLIRDIGDAKERRYRELVAAEGLVPLPGAAEWVAMLAEREWRQAIASSAPRLNVEVVVAALGFSDLLGTFVAAEDVARGKPEPDVFQAAARRLLTPEARCVVVEDAAAGVEAARRAGMASVGVGGETVAAADIVVASLADLPRDAFDRLVAP